MLYSNFSSWQKCTYCLLIKQDDIRCMFGVLPQTELSVLDFIAEGKMSQRVILWRMIGWDQLDVREEYVHLSPFIIMMPHCTIFRVYNCPKVVPQTSLYKWFSLLRSRNLKWKLFQRYTKFHYCPSCQRSFKDLQDVWKKETGEADHHHKLFKSQSSTSRLSTSSTPSSPSFCKSDDEWTKVAYRCPLASEGT